MTVLDADISNALLISTRDGTYPDSEEVLAAGLTISSLQPSLHLIEEAKHQIETEIRGLSQNSSTNVDEWITQARQLQEDIEHSKAIAREIVKEYEEGQNLSAKVQDAEAKLALLQNETSFNQGVISSLEQTWSVDKDLNEAEVTLVNGGLVELAANIQQLSSRTWQLADSNAKDINNARLLRIRNAVVEGFTSALNSLVVFRKVVGGQQLIVKQGNHDSLAVSLEYLLEALEKFGSLDSPLRTLSRTFQKRISQPVLSRSSDAVTCSLDEASQCLTLSTGENKKDAQSVMNCVLSIFVFLHDHLPTRLGSAIGNMLSEELVGTLIRDWLTPSIPLGLSDLRQSYNIQTTVGQLADLIFSYQWPGHQELRMWIERVPHTWLEQRRTSALDAVRATFKAPRGQNRKVHRIERQDISSSDDAFAYNGVDASNNHRMAEEPDSAKALTNPAGKEEEDLSGWDFDEDTENNGDTGSSPKEASGDVEDSSEAWGWDEDNPDKTRLQESGSPVGNASTVPISDATANHEVTLTETYTITDIPDHLLDIIFGEVQDAGQLNTTEYADFEKISASADILSLPNLILAMFRAIAPAHYTTTISNGNMHLYNDCVYMVEKLKDLEKGTSMAQLRKDCDVLEKFGRSAYAREMEVQWTVLGDLLDGAQGFVNCTRFPYSAECDNAVSSTIDRVRAVHQDWSSILSHSALLQSTGSLLSSVIEKIVKDIEDMEDISESESQRLAAFCSQFSALEDLFMSERPAPIEEREAEVVPLTAVYVPNWLRFQYLSNILESSLVDIKYLWTEGELSLEFTADEVIELVEALFAESSHRRSAIAEIRHSRL